MRIHAAVGIFKWMLTHPPIILQLKIAKII